MLYTIIVPHRVQGVVMTELGATFDLAIRSDRFTESLKVALTYVQQPYALCEASANPCICTILLLLVNIYLGIVVLFI